MSVPPLLVQLIYKVAAYSSKDVTVSTDVAYNLHFCWEVFLGVISDLLYYTEVPSTSKYIPKRNFFLIPVGLSYYAYKS